MAITNPKLDGYLFLDEMYRDDFFPNSLVDKGKAILVELCEQLETEKPMEAEEVFQLTHAATESFNDLQEEFYECDSEIETAARECIAADFEFITKAYGYELDVEELIAPRDW
ncbi:MAG: DUF5713 family protein [Planctomycetota bacterium]